MGKAHNGKRMAWMAFLVVGQTIFGGGFLLAKNAANQGQKISIPFGSEKEMMGFIPMNDIPQKEGEGPAPKIMDGPAAFARDAAGNFFFLDTSNVCVKKFDATGKFLAEFPYPVVNPKKEYRYVDIQVAADGTMILLDAENNYLIHLDSAGKILGDRTIQIPQKTGNFPVLVERFFQNSDGRILTVDMSTNNVLELDPKEKTKEGFNQAHLRVRAANFETSLQTDGEGRIVGFQASPEDPESLEFFAQKPGSEKADKLFKTEKIPGLAFAEILSVTKSGVTVAIHTGGEIKTVLSEIRIYDFKGGVASSQKTEFRQVTWPMGRKYHVEGQDVFLLEYQEKENRLDIHHLKI